MSSGSVFVPAGVDTFKIDLESQQVSRKNFNQNEMKKNPDKRYKFKTNLCSQHVSIEVQSKKFLEKHL